MAKFFGKIGYREVKEVRPGINLPVITEREYFGDVLRNISQQQESSTTENDELRLSNEISVIADQWAYECFANIAYIEYIGVKWNVSRVEVRPPRLHLFMGGVYNDPETNEYYPEEEDGDTESEEDQENSGLDSGDIIDAGDSDGAGSTINTPRFRNR